MQDASPSTSANGSPSGNIEPATLHPDSSSAVAAVATSSKAKGKKRARETEDSEETHLSYIPEADMSVYDFSKSSS